MVRRRRKGTPATSAHDRRTSEPPYGAETASSVEEDPYAPGDRIVVLRSIRDDPLAGLLSRGHIDQAQFQAGRRWQACYERAGIGMVIAMDPTKEPVDGHGPGHADVTDSQLEAFEQLHAAGKTLGTQGNILVHLVLGQGLAIKELCRRRNELTEIKIKYFGQRLRECLETLAQLWGFVSTGRNR